MKVTPHLKWSGGERDPDGYFLFFGTLDEDDCVRDTGFCEFLAKFIEDVLPYYEPCSWDRLHLTIRMGQGHIFLFAKSSATGGRADGGGCALYVPAMARAIQGLLERPLSPEEYRVEAREIGRAYVDAMERAMDVVKFRSRLGRPGVITDFDVA